MWDGHGTAAEMGAELLGAALPWSPSVCVVTAGPREEAGAGPVVSGCTSSGCRNIAPWAGRLKQRVTASPLWPEVQDHGVGRAGSSCG